MNRMNRLVVEDSNHAETDIMDTGGEVWGVGLTESLHTVEDKNPLKSVH